MDSIAEAKRTVVVAVDFQPECASGDGAWPIHNGAEVLKNAASVLAAARRAGLPIVYTKHVLDPGGLDSFRYEPRSESGRPLHSVRGDRKGEICDEVAPMSNDIIVEKQRWSGFYGTKMDLVLRRLDTTHLIMMGIWTESCFETTVWDALWRDYKITIVKDACSSATELMHMTAILDMANWLYGGMIVSAAEVVKAIGGRPYKAWHFKSPSQFKYTLTNIDELYGSI